MKQIYIYLCIFITILLVIFYNYTPVSESFQEEETYTAVIVEPRRHKALSFVLNTFLTNLSEKWKVIIFHGNLNKEYVNDIIQKDLPQYINRIQLEHLPIDNLTADKYSNLLVSESFYDKIPTETFLIFQTDTMINEKEKDKINDFLTYDYVGAPWKSTRSVGNGGLSLRKKSKMLEKIRSCKYEGKEEDLFFSNDACLPLNKPDFEKAKEFSVEQVYYDKPFGVHKAYDTLSKSELSKLEGEITGLEDLKFYNKS